MTRFSTLLIAAAAGVALPAVASAAPKPAETEASTNVAPSGAAAKPQRYCVVGAVTGSRLEHRECKTLDAWLKEGFDPRSGK